MTEELSHCTIASPAWVCNRQRIELLHRDSRRSPFQLITIAFKDGEDTPLYLEKLLKKAIQELETIAAEESEE